MLDIFCSVQYLIFRRVFTGNPRTLTLIFVVWNLHRLNQALSCFVTDGHRIKRTIIPLVICWFDGRFIKKLRRTQLRYNSYLSIHMNNTTLMPTEIFSKIYLRRNSVFFQQRFHSKMKLQWVVCGKTHVEASCKIIRKWTFVVF